MSGKQEIKTSLAGTWQGQDVTQFTLDNGQGMRASILNWAGILQRLDATMSDGRERNLVLGLDDFADYPEKSPNFGATIGRFGNRIGGASFKIGEQIFHLDANEAHGNHIHGGRAGFGKRLWRADADLTKHGPAVRLTIQSDPGDMGYPGLMQAQCTYTLTDKNVLLVEMSATVDQPCPVNMVHHSYWNLDDQIDSIDHHKLMLNASHYLPTGEGQIPTGDIAPVAGTNYDFRERRLLDFAGPPEIDFAFVLDGNPGLRKAAELTSSDGHCHMVLHTNQPAVQCYSGFKIGVQPSSGKSIGPRAGLCLETEAFPDAPNKPHFPSCILNPGETYSHVMEHHFSFP